MSTEDGGKAPAGTQAGKRYKCAKCGTEVLVTKPSAGALQCCGEAMELK